MITTIRLKDLIKKVFVLLTIALTIVSINRFISELRKNKENISIEKTEKKSSGIEKIIELSLPIANMKVNNISNENKQSTDTLTSRSGISRMLSIELPNIEENSQNNEENNKIETINDNTNNEENNEKTTEIKENYTNNYGDVKVKNSTGIKLTESILKPDYNIKNKKNVIIYHTHTCESYTQTEKNTYKPSGNYRTTDLNYSVVKVGDILKQELEKRKFVVTHDTTKHDYPAYSGSYERSLKTVKNILSEQNETEMIIDLHRDAIGSNEKFAPIVEIKGEKVSQLMFVIGTNDGGGKHPNWKNNLKFAVKVQEIGNKLYPGLFRPINLRSATFNQKVSNAAIILEVGATGNTLEESNNSMKYFAEILKEALK